MIWPIGPGGIWVGMAGGNDHVTHLALSEGTLPNGSLHVDLGAGDDEFKGADGRETVTGGPATTRSPAGPATTGSRAATATTR